MPWRDCGNCLPHKTIATLPPDGIVLQLSVSIERPLVAKHAISWPPTIRPHDVVAGMEGISSRYGVYQLFARVGTKEVYA